MFAGESFLLVEPPNYEGERFAVSCWLIAATIFWIAVASLFFIKDRNCGSEETGNK